MKTRLDTFFVCLTLGCVTTTTAQRPALVPVTDPAQEARPIAYARIGPDLKRKGPWIPIRYEETSPQTASWVMAFDITNANPLNPGVFYTGYYGTPYAPVYFGPQYNAPHIRNDMLVNPPASGRTAKFLSADITWNPNGTAPASGSARMLYAVYNGHGFDPILDALSGLVWDLGMRGAGRHLLTIDLSQIPAPFGLGLPYTGGYTAHLMGTMDGNGQFMKLIPPGSCQWNLANMCQPGDPVFPGTNPSSSSQWCWLDDDPADFFLEPHERYSMNYQGYGIIEPIVGLFVDDNTHVIRGQVSLQDLDFYTPRPVRSVRFVVRQQGTTNVVYDQVAAIDPAGDFEILAPLADGLYDIYAIASHWLTKAAFGVLVLAGNPIYIHIPCPNGDSDVDNEIGIGDFAIVSAAFGSSYDTATGTAYGPWDFMADLNHDDEVDIGDYAIMSRNFGLFGD